MWEVAEGDAAYAARRSTPWSVAWHALEIVDYDLTGDLAPFSPPPPFTDKVHWRDLTLLPSAWSPSELVAYLDELRRRVNAALSVMTDEEASTPLPGTHRYKGQPYAWLLTSIRCTPSSTRRRSGNSSPAPVEPSERPLLVERRVPAGPVRSGG
jgi:hypothetical protein